MDSSSSDDDSQTQSTTGAKETVKSKKHFDSKTNKISGTTIEDLSNCHNFAATLSAASTNTVKARNAYKTAVAEYPGTHAADAAAAASNAAETTLSVVIATSYLGCPRAPFEKFKADLITRQLNKPPYLNQLLRGEPDTVRSLKEQSESKFQEKRSSTASSKKNLGFPETNLAEGESPKKQKVSKTRARITSPNKQKNPEDEDSSQSGCSGNPEVKRKFADSN